MILQGSLSVSSRDTRINVSVERCDRVLLEIGATGAYCQLHLSQSDLMILSINLRALVRMMERGE